MSHTIRTSVAVSTSMWLSLLRLLILFIVARIVLLWPATFNVARIVLLWLAVIYYGSQFLLWIASILLRHGLFVYGSYFISLCIAHVSTDRMHNNDYVAHIHSCGSLYIPVACTVTL